VVVVIVAVDRHTGEIVTGPEVITRGWVFAPEAEELLEEAREAVRTAIAESARGSDGRGGGGADVEALRRRVRSAVGRLVSERTRRRPMIVPVVMEA
jgi:ribonuclease J